MGTDSSGLRLCEPGCDPVFVQSRPFLTPGNAQVWRISAKRAAALAERRRREINHDGRPAMLTEPLMSIPEKPRAVPMSRSTLARRLLGSPAVSEFIDGVMLYVLSKEWYDAFATHMLKLHPLPYCSEDDSQLPCTLEASASSQLCFAVTMLLGASVLVRLADWFDESTSGGRSLSIVPPMAGMCVGWAFGFAAVKWLAELDGSVGLFQAHPGLANLALSAVATLGAAVLIVVCRPSTLGLACGVTPHGLPTTARRAARVVLGELEVVWRLSARALSVGTTCSNVPSWRRRSSLA